VPSPAPLPERWSQPVVEPECPAGWTTGPPDFVGVGAQRAGTSGWYAGAIRSHPGVVEAPDRGKETHFFDRYWTEEPPPDFAERYARLFPRPAGSITGEWTPRYMHDPWTLRLLAEAAPEARVLILLRDPLERYRSGIAWAIERSRQRGLEQPNIASVGDAIARSLYQRQVERAFELFGRERVLVLQHERCVADPVAEMQRTQRFLGIEPAADASPRLRREKRSKRSKPELPAAFRDELRELMRDDARRLAELCPEIDISLWPSVEI
jgi:hypothetical protein